MPATSDGSSDSGPIEVDRKQSDTVPFQPIAMLGMDDPARHALAGSMRPAAPRTETAGWPMPIWASNWIGTSPGTRC